ncbi:serine/threonine protein kinase [Myxococcus sp. CA051A]|uniref:serine/threonine-protein kinase n=1 Tax=unclassified Myxococcus TaxID=2648731 RepID=UPI00157B8B6F|nr:MULTISPECIES: serine/threonine-protein kinase [unclassified Myxococcus]NTX17050.1 serine/threonine protein kinase [Myxococcus sp. CA056]NTX63564.1 serine/threonine protein kinase [Myxococcus sp. CA051A]
MTLATELGMLGRYRLRSRLASGGMAELFLAVLPGAEGFEKPVVIKRMLPRLAAQETYRQMFAQEARLMATFGHAHVVSALDFGVEQDSPYLVLEYVDGVDLGRVLGARRTLPPPLVRYVGLSLLHALEHVHGLRDARGELLGIVHRDISPANVLLGRTGDVKLTDFGIAKGLRTPSHTAPGSTRGRLRYMSPEQVQGGPLDGRADLFSLAVLLYEAVVGQGPFSATNDAQLLLAVRDARLAPTEDLRRTAGPALADVLLRALRRHPSERYATAGEMARALAAVDGTGESEQPWRVAEVVAETLTSEGTAPAASRGAGNRGPFSAALLELREDDS